MKHIGCNLSLIEIVTWFPLDTGPLAYVLGWEVVPVSAAGEAELLALLSVKGVAGERFAAVRAGLGRDVLTRT